jgi:hypothetical protein
MAGANSHDVTPHNKHNNTIETHQDASMALPTKNRDAQAAETIQVILIILQCPFFRMFTD